MAFYLRFERDGEDLYPLIRQVIAEGRVPDWNRVRYEMFKRPGLLRHRVERAFQRVRALVHQARPPRPDRGVQHPAGRVHPPLREPDRRLGQACARSCESDAPASRCNRSHEYGSLIIHTHGNRHSRASSTATCANHGLIDNLPRAAASKCPCLVDKNGIQPTQIGALPPQLAALMQTNINVQCADRRGRADRQARAYLPRRHARPAHRRRTGPGPDLGAGRRPDRGARRLAAGLSVGARGRGREHQKGVLPHLA